MLNLGDGIALAALIIALGQSFSAGIRVWRDRETKQLKIDLKRALKEHQRCQDLLYEYWQRLQWVERNGVVKPGAEPMLPPLPPPRIMAEDDEE